MTQNVWKISECKECQNPPLTTFLFRCTTLTGMAAIGCFLTTGMAFKLSIITLSIGLLITIWGQAPISTLGWLVQILTIPWLLWSYREWAIGVPGIVALSEFAIGVLVLQWLQMQRISEARQALILAGMVVLAVAAMSINFVFPIALLPFVICFLLTLLSIANHSSRLKKAKQSMWSILLRGLVLMVVLWIGLFYLLPRPYDIFGLTSGNPQHRMRGFSETLSLNESGHLEDNPLVVMRVRPIISGDNVHRLLPKLQNMLFRGCTFQKYERGTWSRPDFLGRRYDLRRSGGEMMLRSFNNNDSRPEIDLEILLESIDPPILLLPNQAILLRSNLPQVWVQYDGTLNLPTRRFGIEIYQTRVKLGFPTITEDFPRNIDWPPYLRLFLDTGDSSGAIADLANDVAGSATTILETVRAVEKFLQENFTYSLEGTPAGVRDPVSHFLLSDRKGSCEHFASGMTLMLRYLGIPARPVNGYLMNEWNKFGGFFTIRQQDAHSWVEVYLPNYGWTAFDPTPPNAIALPSKSRWMWPTMAILWERFEGFWFNYVYRFDRELQMAGFRRLYQTIRNLADRNFLWIGILIIIMCAILLAANRRRSSRQHSRSGWLPDWYHEFCQALPVSRNSWETPREFHRRLLAVGIIPVEESEHLAIIEREVAAAAFGGDPEGAAIRSRKSLLRLLSCYKKIKESAGTGNI